MGIWKKIAESIKDAGDDWEEVQDLLDEGDIVNALVLVNEKLKEVLFDFPWWNLLHCIAFSFGRIPRLLKQLHKR